LPNPPDFSDIDDMNPVMDFDISSSNSTGSAAPRDLGGRREVEDWPLKVQKMASVWSVTLYFVSLDNLLEANADILKE
jgi:hypothetical protein